MSDESEEVNVDDGPSKPTTPLVRNVFQKKREFYGKTHHKSQPSSSAQEKETPSSPNIPDPSPSSAPLAPSPSKPAAPSLWQLPDRPPRTARQVQQQQQQQLLPGPWTLGSFLKTTDVRPCPQVFGEHLTTVCTVLKNNLVLLKQELVSLQPKLELRDLFVILEDIRRAKEELDRRVSRPLVDVQTELERRIAAGQLAVATSHNISGRHTINGALVPNFPTGHHHFPFTPTPLHPFPPFSYLSAPQWPPPAGQPFELLPNGKTPLPAVIPEPTNYVPTPSMSAQPAH